MTPIQIGGLLAGCIIWIGWCWLVTKLFYNAVIAHEKRKRWRAARKKYDERWWEQ